MQNESEISTIGRKLDRLLELVERFAPEKKPEISFDNSEAFVWQTNPDHLEPVKIVNRISIDLLCGIDHSRDIVIKNTEKFSQGLPANNLLLWGARGMGKSSLIKAVHAFVNEQNSSNKDSHSLKLIEIHREDIESLPKLLNVLRNSAHQFILFCDDLSFDAGDTSYKSLKSVLEGGIQGRPANVIFYATSNRRHLMSRDMMENERSTAINPSEAIEENVSLSDRFGLWVGIHNCTQEDYLNMVKNYVNYYKLKCDSEKLRREALEWSTTRGARSGRVAFQFIQDLAGRLGKHLDTKV